VHLAGRIRACHGKSPRPLIFAVRILKRAEGRERFGLFLIRVDTVAGGIDFGGGGANARAR
jgi:hypothetical protein